MGHHKKILFVLTFSAFWDTTSYEQDEDSIILAVIDNLERLLVKKQKSAELEVRMWTFHKNTNNFCVISGDIGVAGQAALQRVAKEVKLEHGHVIIQLH